MLTIKDYDKEQEAVKIIRKFQYEPDKGTPLENIFEFYKELYGPLAHLAINYPTTEVNHKEYVQQLKNNIDNRKVLMIKNSWIKRHAKEGYYKDKVVGSLMDIEYLKGLTIAKMLRHPIMIYTTQLGKMYIDTYRRKGPSLHGTTNKQKIKAFYIRKRAASGYYTDFDNRHILILSTPELMEHEVWEATNSTGTMKEKD